ncbi:hypothetical protein E0Z10_g2631 [Xylaria hypoxylon]|uniref:ABM domain-containing protein n=1 Tax=Xylaria hypoxylon TaxID=37992 RepID=A0A4Z0Z1J9_9PEZI|nr:hypothetical protein E0Z10_g2631 [Xylaria hypoxylon]
MPITELAWIPSATPGSIPLAFIEAGQKAMEAQSEWAVAHASSILAPGPPAARGAALYRQHEDRGVVLVTAHWDSAAQHAECIAGKENQQAMKAVASHSIISDIKFFHVDGVQMFGKETLDAGLLSILRISVGVEEGKREQVERIWNDAKNLLFTSAGFEHTGGWKIEKDQGKEDRDEFVVVGAWRHEDALSRFAEGKEWENALAWDEMWKGVVLEMDVKTYSRIA